MKLFLILFGGTRRRDCGKLRIPEMCDGTELDHQEELRRCGMGIEIVGNKQQVLAQ